jgi:hypothetical protein
MPKIANTALPKITRKNRKSLPAKVIQEAIEDLVGSVDFSPHAYTDGTEYPTYSEAQSVANITIRQIGEDGAMPSNMIRRRVWDANGNKDRAKKGKWMFALSQRSEPPKPRQPRSTVEAATA